MPGRGIMRAKQKRAGSLGQSSKFCTLGCSGKKIASSQGFGYNNPSRGSMVSLVNAIQNQAVSKKCLNKNEKILSNFFYHQGPNSTVYSNLMKNANVIGAKVKISKPDIFSDCEVAYELSNI